MPIIRTYTRKQIDEIVRIELKKWLSPWTKEIDKLRLRVLKLEETSDIFNELKGGGKGK